MTSPNFILYEPNEHFQKWFETHITTNDKCYMSVAECNGSYQKWFKENFSGLDTKPIGKTELKNRISKLVGKNPHSRKAIWAKKSVNLWMGL